MNPVLVEIPMDKNLNQTSSKKTEKSLFSDVNASQFQPIFTQFLKGTELIGKVNETLLKKFGDTYIESGSKQNSSYSKFEPFHEKSKLNNSQNKNQKVIAEKGNHNPVEEKSTPEKPMTKANQFSRTESKGSLQLKSLPVSGLNYKLPNTQVVKPNSLSQPSFQSIKNVSKVQLVNRITQIIHGKISSIGIKSATYKINGGQWGELEIKLTQKNSITKATIVVESDSLKSTIEKIVTEVKENLNEKGMRFESFNVEVGSDKNNFNYKNSFTQKIFIETEHEETQDSEQNVLRQFGYNTIEVIA